MIHPLRALACFALSLPCSAETERKVPLVTWNDYEQTPHDYYELEPQDPASVLFRQIKAGTKTPDTTSGKAYAMWLMRELHIPLQSQMLVFSKTGLQRKVVSPETPRAMFFNDHTAVTWIQDGMIEIESFDPQLGPVFYILEGTEKRDSVQAVKFARRESCLNGCHAGSATNYLPGMLARSLHTDALGNPARVDKSGIAINAISVHENMSHAMPIKERWGGWYVTGAPAGVDHLGNLFVPKKGQDLPAPDLSGLQDLLPHGHSSNIVALLIHDHQIGLMNALYQALYRWRTHRFFQKLKADGVQDQRLEVLSSGKTHHVEASIHRVVDELLFKDEAPLPSTAITPDPAFVQVFTAAAKKDAQGRSLRDLDLSTRILKHRCSHLIYCPQLQGMPAEFRTAIYQRLRQSLSDKASHLPEAERQAVLQILESTLSDFPKA
jgi:hypothetical protein